VVVGTDSKADTFMTSDNAVLRYETIKYLTSEMLLRKNYFNE
jgi:hypothetical protein